MPEAEYLERTALARESLRGFLRPLSDYLTIYERVTARRPLAPSRAV